MLKEHQAGATAADLCRKLGISDATFYTWWPKLAGWKYPSPQAEGVGGKEPQAEEAAREPMLDVSTLRNMVAKNF